MKADLYEYEQTFQLSLTAENLKDAAILARWNMNAKTKVIYRELHVYEDGTFQADLGWDRRFDSIDEIKR